MPITLIDLLQTRALRIGMLLFSIHWLMLPLGVPGLLMIKLGDATLIPMSALASYVYGRNLFKRHPYRTLVRDMDLNLVQLGICGSWMVTCMMTGWRMAGRLLDLPVASTYMNSYVVSACLFSLTYFAALHVFIRNVDHTVRRDEWRGHKMVLLGLVATVPLYILVFLYE